MHRPSTQRALIALVQVLSLAVWFSASAVVPVLRAEWAVTAAAAVWLTASVQIGFVVGAVSSAVLNLPDRLPPPLMMAVSAALAAACTFLFAFTATGWSVAVPLRFVTGIFWPGFTRWG